ncbi:TRAP transporter small permease [Thermodesulfobacteriota bacterium]
MMFQKFIHVFEGASTSVARVLIRAGLASLLAMMFLTAVDVCGRYLLNKPIRGALELTEFLLVITVAAGLAYTQVSKRHVSVDLVVSRLPGAIQKMMQAISHTICLVMYALISWQGIKGGQNQWRHGITSGAFEIPLWPFYFFLAFGCGILCLVYLADLLKLISPQKGDT